MIDQKGSNINNSLYSILFSQKIQIRFPIRPVPATWILSCLDSGSSLALAVLYGGRTYVLGLSTVRLELKKDFIYPFLTFRMAFNGVSSIQFLFILQKYISVVLTKFVEETKLQRDSLKNSIGNIHIRYQRHYFFVNRMCI